MALLMPLPCVGDDVFNVWILRLPAEYGLGAFAGANEAWRISRAAIARHRNNLFTRHLTRHLNHFFDRKSAAIPQVEERSLTPFELIFQPFHMGIG